MVDERVGGAGGQEPVMPQVGAGQGAGPSPHFPDLFTEPGQEYWIHATVGPEGTVALAAQSKSEPITQKQSVSRTERTMVKLRQLTENLQRRNKPITNEEAAKIREFFTAFKAKIAEKIQQRSMFGKVAVVYAERFGILKEISQLEHAALSAQIPKQLHQLLHKRCNETGTPPTPENLKKHLISIFHDKSFAHLRAALLKQPLSPGSIDYILRALGNDTPVGARFSRLQTCSQAIFAVHQKRAKGEPLTPEEQDLLPMVVLTPLSNLQTASFIHDWIEPTQRVAEGHFEARTHGLATDVHFDWGAKHVYVGAPNTVPAEGTSKSMTRVFQLALHGSEEPFHPRPYAHVTLKKPEDLQQRQVLARQLAIQEELRKKGVPGVAFTVSETATSRQFSAANETLRHDTPPLPSSVILPLGGLGNLSDLLSTITLDEEIALLGDLLETGDAMHEAGVIHADLKPGNITVTSEGKPLVIDFEAAFFARPGDKIKPTPAFRHDTYMTPEFAAPELCCSEGGFDLKKATIESYRKTDCFALGCTLFTLRFKTNVLPWFQMAGTLGRQTLQAAEKAPIQQMMLALIAENDANLDKMAKTARDKRLSHYLTLIRGLLQADPAKRLSMKEARAYYNTHLRKT